MEIFLWYQYLTTLYPTYHLIYKSIDIFIE